ncbi:MAG: 2'-5' RNA ligase family protein [archaeon]|jgi:2'-5' RNA ligase
MARANVTVTVCLPDKIEKQFFKIINPVFKGFGKYRLKNNKVGIYYNIPHITLLSLGDCLEKREEITKRIEPVLKNIKPFNIESKELACFTNEGECHVVVEIKRTKELLDLHKKVYAVLADLFEGDKQFVLDNFCPHITIISSVPVELGEKIKTQINLGKLDFVATQVGVKTKIQGDHAKYYKLFEL